MAYNLETGMYEGYIYCIENLINKKKYIGYTKNDIQIRWEQHLSKTHHKEDHSIVHLAIDKYGEENFIIYIAETISRNSENSLKRELKKQEQVYIALYNTLTPNGYNILRGGEDAPVNRKHPVYQFTMDGEYIRSYDTVTEAVHINGFDDVVKNSKILYSLKHDHCAFGFLWDDVLDGNVVNKYIAYAMRKNTHKSNRKKSCNKTKTQKKLKKRIEKRDKTTGELLCVFDGYVELKNIYNDKDIKQISKCCCGFQNTAVGYHWCFESQFDLSKLSHTNRKQVCKYDMNGIYIETYASALDAAKSFDKNVHASASTIRSACNGNIKSAYGFKWRYRC